MPSPSIEAQFIVLKQKLIELLEKLNHFPPADKKRILDLLNSDDVSIQNSKDGQRKTLAKGKKETYEFLTLLMTRFDEIWNADNENLLSQYSDEIENKKIKKTAEKQTDSQPADIHKGPKAQG